MTANPMTKAHLTETKFTIDIQVESPAWNTSVPNLIAYVKETVQEAIMATSFPESCEVCVLLTTDAEVKDLNKDFRGQDKPTNVLSFPGLEPHELRGFFGLGIKKQDSDPIYLGDLALAYETISREAAEQKKTFINHLTHLIVHGTLHLLGYDHMNPKEADQMEALETKILKTKFNIDNPYRSEDK